jgi:hypothetical protein
MHKSSLDREIPGSTKFSLPQIQKATKNFSPNFKIGQGGSGTVYKGQLADGTLVAVKRAKKVFPSILMTFLCKLVLGTRLYEFPLFPECV